MYSNLRDIERLKLFNSFNYKCKKREVFEKSKTFHIIQNTQGIEFDACEFHIRYV